MKKTGILVITLLVSFQLSDVLFAQSFTGSELLSRPTDHSVTVNVIANTAYWVYFEFGTVSGTYPDQTGSSSAAADEPITVLIDGLTANTRYYYRMRYNDDGGSTWATGNEYTFHTQRAEGETFTFTMASDSHLGETVSGSTPGRYEQTTLNVAADQADFHLDLGDAFITSLADDQSEVNDLYLDQRPYFGNFSHSSPVFLVTGNQENEEGWNLDDTPFSRGIANLIARKQYFPNPVPNGFYSANTDRLTGIGGDEFREDYYAWEWGGVLFIVLDPFQYSTYENTRPYSVFPGSGEEDDELSDGDQWHWSLGYEQFEWLKTTLENSDARFKFVFSHHVTGGQIALPGPDSERGYVHGGAMGASYFEWGGYNNNDTWGFAHNRPGWGEDPIHQIMVNNGVDAFFHGHDHQFVHEEIEGIAYQLVPSAGMTGYGFDQYDDSPYVQSGGNLPNAGHIRVTMTQDQALVEYVRSEEGGGGINGDVDYAYTITLNSTNTAPVVEDIPAQSVAEGSTFSTINLDDFVSDTETADEDISWTYSGNTELSVGIVDRVATVTAPHVNWNGSEAITFTATDDDATDPLSDSDAAMFTITPVNDSPVVSDIPNQSVPEGSSFVSIDLDNFVDDRETPDEDISWTYAGDVYLTVNIVGQVATISTPGANWNGSETITFTATDDDATDPLSDSDAAMFTITPVNDSPDVDDIPDQSVPEGSNFVSIDLDNYVYDRETPDEDISWTYVGDVDLTVSIVGQVATISIPGADWNGSETITFTATDDDATDPLSDSDAAMFTITPVNDSPVVDDIPYQSVPEGSSFVTVDLDNYVDDQETPDEDISWTYTGNVQLTVSIVDRLATVSTPNADWNGKETITFTATDDDGTDPLSDSDAATFTVTGVNDSPVIDDVPDQSVPEGSNFVIFDLDNYVDDRETPDEDISWMYDGNNELTVSIVDRLVTVSIPSVDWNGSETITFTATDGDATDPLSDSDAAIFTVISVNDAPAVSDIPDQVIVEGNTFTDINLDNYVTDDETVDKNISWTYMETTQLMVSIVDRVAAITVPADWTGSDTIVFIATDDNATTPLSSSDTVIFTVTLGTGIASHQTISIKAYPNPNEGSFFIELSEMLKGEIILQVFTVHGELVKNSVHKMLDNHLEMNIQDQPSGNYFIRLQSADFIETIQITKQ